MKKYLLTAAALAALTVSAHAEKVVLQLKWVTQAQFAGYYVAQAKGYYKAAGLEVEIKPGGPDIAPEQIIAGGGADVIVDWMPAALAAREKGNKLVNIAQPFKHSGLMLTCRKETGIAAPADFKGAQQPIRAQPLGVAPRLRDRAAGAVRRIPVEDFGQVAETGRAQVFFEAVEQLAQFRRRTR